MSPTTPANLPHRSPFLFVSSIESLGNGRGEGRWLVRGDEDFFAGHFPGNPVLPGVLLAESLAQLSGLVAFANDGAGAARAARLAQVNVKFPSGVVPPAEVHLYSTLAKEMDGLFLFDVRAEVVGVVMAQGSVVLSHKA